MPCTIMCPIFNVMHINTCVLAFSLLMATLYANAAQAEVRAALGLQQQRWLEDQGKFVSESGLLPRVDVALQLPTSADTTWLAGGSVYAGDVTYRGVNQNSQATVNSQTRYRGVDLQIDRTQQLTPTWMFHSGLVLSRWRRDIYNPSLARDQSEIFRVAQVQIGLGYTLDSRIGFGVDLHYPLWARVEALLGDYGFEHSPVLQMTGKVSLGARAEWRMDKDVALQLQWSRLRFSGSSPQSVGNVLVQQPASQLDAVYLMLAKVF